MGSLTHFAHNLVGQLKFLNMCSHCYHVSQKQTRFWRSLETRPECTCRGGDGGRSERRRNDRVIGNLSGGLGFGVGQLGISQREIVVDDGKLIGGELSQDHETSQRWRQLPRTIEAMHHVTNKGDL